MKIRRDHEYAHGTDTVYALFTDRKAVKAKQKALGARNLRIQECRRSAGGAVVSFVRELPADVPGALSKFVQPWNIVEQLEQWTCYADGVYQAELDVDIAGVPVTVAGTLELEPRDAGCVNHVRMTIECGIPFIGKTLADFVAKDCKRLIADEYKYISDRLDSA
jgi:hypothetical protein